MMLRALLSLLRIRAVSAIGRPGFSDMHRVARKTSGLGASVRDSVGHVNRRSRPGHTVAEGKRRARKRKNQLRHKAHLRRGSRQ